MEVFIGIMIPFVGTALGAFTIFLFKEEISKKVMSMFLAAAAGIMVSASFFSLILPALEGGKSAIVPVALGFMFGGVFLYILDRILPHFHAATNTREGPPSKLHKTTMMMLAVTLHNIPEGMAVGLLYGVALKENDPTMMSGALALSIGIALQNIPEGAAISLPMKQNGISNIKAFWYGVLSGAVEPIGALISIFFVSLVTGIMPWLLSFAAGAMIYVVVEELIPEAQSNKHNDSMTFVFMIGFVVMMVLDVVLS